MRRGPLLAFAGLLLLIPACALDRAGLRGMDGAVPPSDSGGDPVDSGGGRVDAGGDPLDGGGPLDSGGGDPDAGMMSCLEGATRCAGMMIERCTGGVWQPAEACPGIGGACRMSGGAGVCTRWIPANIPTGDIDRVFSGRLSELIISAPATIDTDSCDVFLSGSPLVLGQRDAGSGDPEICVLRGSRIVINAQLAVVGSRALVLLSEGDIEINALVDAASYGDGIPGPAANTGGRAGANAMGGAQAGGGGGASCGAGGVGGHGTIGGLARPMGYLLAPLRGGSRGGTGRAPGASGMATPGGAGGGALQLSAGGRIVLSSTGELDVSGAGGNGGPGGEGGGGGGGSGGGLLLEGLRGFTLDGSIFLGGGGGGGGGKGNVTHIGSPGEDGLGLLTRRARGGAGGNNDADQYGGDGGFWENAAGQIGGDDGNTDHGGGGGGGGAGCIGFYSRDGTAPTVGGPAGPLDPSLRRTARSRFE